MDRRGVPAAIAARGSGRTDRQAVVGANLGRANSAFLRFDSSGDICELNLETGELKTIVSAHDVGQFEIPAENSGGPLGAGGSCSEDVSNGFVYHVGAVTPGEETNCMRLVDSDRDGTIDSVMLPAEPSSPHRSAPARGR